MFLFLEKLADKRFLALLEMTATRHLSVRTHLSGLIIDEWIFSNVNKKVGLGQRLAGEKASAGNCSQGNRCTSKLYFRRTKRLPDS